jgi:hypothetical protein
MRFFSKLKARQSDMGQELTFLVPRHASLARTSPWAQAQETGDGTELRW